jgi:hypothetical protein
MSITLSPDVLQDELAASLAQAIAAANRQVRQAGRDPADCLVTITQHPDQGPASGASPTVPATTWPGAVGT